MQFERVGSTQDCAPSDTACVITYLFIYLILCNLVVVVVVVVV